MAFIGVILYNFTEIVVWEMKLRLLLSLVILLFTKVSIDINVLSDVRWRLVEPVLLSGEESRRFGNKVQWRKSQTGPCERRCDIGSHWLRVGTFNSGKYYQYFFFLKNKGHSQLQFIYFCLFNTVDNKQVKKQMFNKILPMTGVVLQTSGFKSDHSTNWATTTS